MKGLLANALNSFWMILTPMKYLLALLFVGALIGCEKEPPETKAEAAKREWGEFVQAMDALSEEQRDKALASARERLQDLDAKIEELQNNLQHKGNEMSAQSREQQKNLSHELEQQAQSLEQWLDGAAAESESAWEALALKAESALEETLQAIDEWFADRTENSAKN